jgi:hypothetical protein
LLRGRAHQRLGVAEVAESTITFLILAGAVVLFMSNRMPVALVALGCLVVVVGHRHPPLDQALAGFGDPTVLFIAATFVVAERSTRPGSPRGSANSSSIGPGRNARGCWRS